jgi:hypothetical protein
VAAPFPDVCCLEHASLPLAAPYRFSIGSRGLDDIN